MTDVQLKCNSDHRPPRPSDVNKSLLTDCEGDDLHDLLSFSIILENTTTQADVALEPLQKVIYLLVI